VMVFKGVPYAAPPIGQGRGSAPEPVKPWTGVRAGDTFGASCIQAIVDERKPWTYEFMTHTEVSEDCLSLNVWTAANNASERRPVYLYIHGGAFREGSGAAPVYDGEGLAKKGVVVVTINYRLSMLGFLAHPELTEESPHQASGNYGLLDQVAALQWVRRNIAAFGGDPDKVTIGGQSAGGMSVHSLIASPLATGLFHRAIVESGGSSIGGGGITMATRNLADAEADGQKFAAAKGAETLAELRAMSWQTLTEPVPSAGRGMGGGFRFSTIVDGYFMTASARETTVQGKQNDVPVLTGVNLGEIGGSMMGPSGPVTVDSYRSATQERYGELAEEFLRLYPATTDEEAGAAQTQRSRDTSLVSMYLWSRERALTSKTPSFLYLWDHTLPGPDAERYGAFHTSEVPYVMNTLYMSDRPFTDADHSIADMLSSYWVNFAAGGDPNGEGLPEWKPAGDEPELMEVGDKNEMVPPAGSTEKYELIERFLTP